MTQILLRRIKHKLSKWLLGFPRNIECNICHWRGRRLLSDSWHPFTICPRCGSQVRHRLLAAALFGSESVVPSGLMDGTVVLHFAPEAIFRDLLGGAAVEYRTADLHRTDVDIQVDMCNMNVIADNAFDVVIACDVLEHVRNDSRALNELNRILRPGGWAVLTVPQKDGLANTYEDPSITTEEGRLAAFGQEDHLRIYGDDFPALLQRHGFAVTTVDEKSFSVESVKKHVLFPPVLSSHPLATNFRKVFFARKLLAI